MPWLFGRKHRRSGIDPAVMRASAEATRQARGTLAEKVIELDRERHYLLMATIDETLDQVERNDRPH